MSLSKYQLKKLEEDHFLHFQNRTYGNRASVVVTDAEGEALWLPCHFNSEKFLVNDSFYHWVQFIDPRTGKRRYTGRYVEYKSLVFDADLYVKRIEDAFSSNWLPKALEYCSLTKEQFQKAFNGVA